MVRLDRILVPLLGGDRALVVLEQVLAFACRRKCRVTALAVDLPRTEAARETGRPIRRRAAGLLAEALRLAERHRFDLDCLYREGEAELVVLRAAEETGADLTVFAMPVREEMGTAPGAHALVVPRNMSPEATMRLLAATRVGIIAPRAVTGRTTVAGVPCGVPDCDADPCAMSAPVSGPAHRGTYPDGIPGPNAAQGRPRPCPAGTPMPQNDNARLRYLAGKDLCSVMQCDSVEEILFAMTSPLLAVLTDA